MLVSKQIADVLTGVRVIMSIYIAWLGITQGEATLPLAIWLLFASWTSDAFDGPLARRSSRRYQTWIGDHDLEVDIGFSAGLVVYMMGAGLVSVLLGGGYLLFWAAFFFWLGVPRSMGMVVQAPIYGWFIWVAMRDAPAAGIWLLVWIASVIILTWPKFPREVVPEWLAGIRAVFERRSPQG